MERKRKRTRTTKNIIQNIKNNLYLNFREQRSQGFEIQETMKQRLDQIQRKIERPKTIAYSLPKNPPMIEKQQRKNTISFSKDETPSCLLQVFQPCQKYDLKKEKNSKIIQLFILALNRRNSGKLLDALDILLLAAHYFDYEKKKEGEVELATICYKLIAKIWRQSQNKTKKVQFMEVREKKKRKSILLKNISSHEKFRQNLAYKWRKTKLIKEGSYLLVKRSCRSLVRINNKCSLTIPTPQELSLDVNNYSFIAITLDDKTCMFPYEYPHKFENFVDKQEYRQLICKLNGILFQERKCYDQSTIIKVNYFYLLLIPFFFLVCIGIGNLLPMPVLILIISIFMIKSSVGHKNYLQVSDHIRNCLINFQEKYQKEQLQFHLTDDLDAILMFWPSKDQEEDEDSLEDIQQVPEISSKIQSSIWHNNPREQEQRGKWTEISPKEEKKSNKSSIYIADSDKYFQEVKIQEKEETERKEN